MKISKIAAEQIALKLMTNHEKRKEKLKQIYINLVTKEYKKTVPRGILRLMKQHSGYLTCGSYLYIRGVGIADHSINMSERLPYNRGGASLEVDSTNTSRISEARRALLTCEEANQKLYNETVGTLLALGTDKKIAEHLPEAIPYLPKPVVLALTVDIDSLRSKLNDKSTVEGAKS